MEQLNFNPVKKTKYTEKKVFLERNYFPPNTRKDNVNIFNETSNVYALQNDHRNFIDYQRADSLIVSEVTGKKDHFTVPSPLQKQTDRVGRRQLGGNGIAFDELFYSHKRSIKKKDDYVTDNTTNNTVLTNEADAIERELVVKEDENCFRIMKPSLFLSQNEGDTKYYKELEVIKSNEINSYSINNWGQTENRRINPIIRLSTSNESKDNQKRIISKKSYSLCESERDHVIQQQKLEVYGKKETQNVQKRNTATETNNRPYDRLQHPNGTLANKYLERKKLQQNYVGFNDKKRANLSEPRKTIIDSPQYEKQNETLTNENQRKTYHKKGQTAIGKEGYYLKSNSYTGSSNQFDGRHRSYIGENISGQKLGNINKVKGLNTHYPFLHPQYVYFPEMYQCWPLGHVGYPDHVMPKSYTGNCNRFDGSLKNDGNLYSQNLGSINEVNGFNMQYQCFYPQYLYIPDMYQCWSSGYFGCINPSSDMLHFQNYGGSTMQPTFDKPLKSFPENNNLNCLPAPLYTGIAGYNWPTVRRPLKKAEPEEKSDYRVYVKPPVIGNEETERIRNAYAKYVKCLRYKLYLKSVRKRKQMERKERNHKSIIASKLVTPVKFETVNARNEDEKLLSKKRKQYQDILDKSKLKIPGKLSTPASRDRTEVILRPHSEPEPESSAPGVKCETTADISTTVLESGFPFERFQVETEAGYNILMDSANNTTSAVAVLNNLVDLSSGSFEISEQSGLQDNSSSNVSQTVNFSSTCKLDPPSTHPILGPVCRWKMCFTDSL